MLMGAWSLGCGRDGTGHMSTKRVVRKTQKSAKCFSVGSTRTVAPSESAERGLQLVYIYI